MHPSHLNNLTVAKLKAIASAAKIKGRSKLKKLGLINAINRKFPGGVPPHIRTHPKLGVAKSRKPVKKSRKPVKKSRKQRVKKSRKPAKSRRSPEAKKSRKSHQKILADLDKSQKMQGSNLSGPDLEAQRKQIYDEIAQRVHSNPDLENFRDILPKNGNFDILEYIGIPYDVMFYLQQTFQKSPEQISDLATAVVHTLIEIVHAQEEALKEALAKKLKRAEIVRHDTPDNFTNMLLGKNEGDIDQWNSLGYTQIERNKITNKNFSKDRRDTSIKKGHWSMKPADYKKPFRQQKPENLLEMSNFTVKGDPNEVMMFHGSREQFMKSLRNAIDWRKGGGYLGNGFYLTFNPNEAKMYACSTVLWGSSGRDEAVILETTIKNANSLKRRDEKTWYSGSGDFRRNYRTDGGKLGMGWHDQINGRDKLLQNLEIKRIHMVPIKNLIVHGSDSNPGSNGQYTVRDKRGWICGKVNRRPGAKKKSRKARKTRKKKTVAEWRAECKKKGLVYDTRTKRCRKSKRKSRKMKYKMRMQKKSSK